MKNTCVKRGVALGAAGLWRVCALALLVALGGADAQAGSYTHPDKIFSVTYDDRIWERDTGDHDLALECTDKACNGAAAGCFVTTEPSADMSVASFQNSFDGADIARAQVEAFAEQKEAIEKQFEGTLTWDKEANVAPEIVHAYAPRAIAGRPFQVAEFRMSMLGELARYASYMTGTAGYSIAIVCHASDRAFETWLPRFEAFVAAIRIAEAPKKQR